jgi:carboxyl-terminal processing protease
VLPASNRGGGQALNFPDVCKTPAPPAPFVPIPYPDLGMNMQAAPFSPFVQIAFMPATNMGTMKVMTAGDEAGAMGGVATGLIKGPGKTTMGNPLVMVTGMPAESLANPTSGNAMNAPVGAQIVPSVVNVMYTFRCEVAASPSCVASAGGAGEAGALSEADIRRLSDVARGEGEAAATRAIESRWLSPTVAYVRIAMFSSHTDREVFNALERLGRDAVTALVLDLRANPGGDADAALRLGAACLARGTVLLLERDRDGDSEAIVARGEPSYRWPMCVLIDGSSASAAELLAATLQYHGRATVLGSRSYGKATAQQALRLPDGGLRYATVAEYLLPDGTAIEGRGIAPDESVEATATALGAATSDDDACVLSALRALAQR